MWLWIIGGVAVIWPMFVARHWGAISDRRRTVDRAEISEIVDFRAEKLRNEIIDLQAMIERQDALIALLWYKLFGSGLTESFGKADLAEFFHQSPEWYVNAMELPGAYDTLCRYGNYPWGKTAEWLRREDFRD